MVYPVWGIVDDGGSLWSSVGIHSIGGSGHLGHHVRENSMPCLSIMVNTGNSCTSNTSKTSNTLPMGVMKHHPLL